MCAPAKKRVERHCSADFMSPNRLSNLTIVVVDDHHEIRRYVGAYLDHLGAHVVVAENAFEGLEAVRTYRPNLVLSDILLPGRTASLCYVIFGLQDLTQEAMCRLSL